MKKNLEPFLWVLLTIGAFAFALAAAPRQAVALRGVVISEGNPLSGVRLDLRCGDSTVHAVSQGDGGFQISAPAGICDLDARLEGYLGVLVKDLDLREPPSESLVVALPEALAAPVGAEAEEVAPAPPLTIELEIGNGTAENEIIKATLTLVNTGTTALPIPTGAWPANRNRFFLGMHVAVSSAQFGARYEQWFGCVPPNGCLWLQPGQSHSFPISLVDPVQGLSATYDRVGEYVFESSVFIVPTGTRYKKTETVVTREPKKFDPIP